jgi:succinate dehydrogenase / fumarate reductase cytochrome b subunit
MRERPLSPHLQVYRWTLTMAMSILHRATGVALSVGTLMIAWMLIAAASGEEAFNQFTNFASGCIGQLMLLGWTLALFYHTFNGIRHMAWDVGMGFEIKTAKISGIVVLVATLLATAAVWCGIYK